MLGTLAIAGVTTASMIALIIKKPEVRVGKRTLGTYWLAALAGALALLLGGFLSPEEAFLALTADAAVRRGFVFRHAAVVP